MKKFNVPGIGIMEVEEADIEAFDEFLDEKTPSQTGLKLNKVIAALGALSTDIGKLDKSIKSMPAPQVKVEPTKVNVPAPIVNVPEVKIPEFPQLPEIKIPEIKNHPKPITKIKAEITERDYRGFAKTVEFTVTRK